MAYGFTGVMMASVMKGRMIFIVCEASPDAEFYELTDENIDHFFGE